VEHHGLAGAWLIICTSTGLMLTKTQDEAKLDTYDILCDTTRLGERTMNDNDMRDCWPGAVYCPPDDAPDDTTVCYWDGGQWASDYTADGRCAFTGQLRRLAIELTDLDRQLDDIEQSEG
jgi:hypothetical protein